MFRASSAKVVKSRVYAQRSVPQDGNARVECIDEYLNLLAI